MKEAKLKIIIGLMAVAVIVLISVQIYWIKNAIKIEEEKFNRDVYQALNLVVEKIDKSKAAEVLIRKFGDRNEKELIWIDEENENKEIILVDSITTSLSVDNHVFVGDSTQLTYQYIHKVNDSGKSSYNSVVISSGERKIVKAELDSLRKVKRKFVTDVVDEIIKKENTFEIQDFEIDSLLSAELDGRGINTGYSFSIVKSPGKNISKQKAAELAEIGNNSENNVFHVRLNPKNIIAPPNFLAVDFPERKSYVLESVSLLLGISIAVILLIVFLFYKTIRMLLNQKRITEIKNDLINNITHEFKTPISTISLATEALNEPQLAGEAGAVKRYSEMIQNENKRLGNLVENLLNTASIQKGNYDLKFEHVDINLLLKKLAEKVKMNGNGKPIIISEKYDEKNPLLFIDEFHISNSIENILDNAVKYSNKQAEIKISTRMVKNYITIEIADKGLGISKPDQKKIFETFYRVPTGNIHNVKGNGIGLSYAKQMVEAHGGKITVNSRPGEGTSFFITLPFGEEDEK